MPTETFPCFPRGFRVTACFVRAFVIHCRTNSRSSNTTAPRPAPPRRLEASEGRWRVQPRAWAWVQGAGPRFPPAVGPRGDPSAEPGSP